MIKITKSFDKSFDHLSMNNRFEVAKFEPEPKVEKAINEIRDDNMKSISSSAKNPSAITSFDKNFDSICIKNSFESAKLEPEMMSVV